MKTKRKVKRTIKRKSNTPRTCKQMLVVLRDFFNQDTDNEQRNLWRVLTALRGPDNRSHSVKMATTCPIRTKALGLKSTAAHFAGFAQEDDFDNVRERVRLSYDHFTTHAQEAFEVLGLEWDKLNKL